MKLLHMLFCTALLFGANTYASDDVPSLAGKRIAISMTGTSHYFDVKAFQAQVDEVKRLGGTPITLDAGRNDKNLVTQLQTVVTQKPDAVIQTLGTLSVIDPWLKRIKAAGIPLFTIDAPSQYSINNTTSDNYAAGRLLAEQLVKDTGGKGNILVFNGFYGVPVCRIRYDELIKALADHPDLKVIQPELRDVIPNTVQDARSQVAALLNKYPKGEIAAIWSAWDIPQLGASQALIDAGRTEIKTYGVDGTPEVQKFAEDLEKVCVDTVESGFMTKDLALLISPDQKWLSTTQFLDKLDENLKKKMG